LIPLLHITGFKVVREEDVGVIGNADVAGMLCGETFDFRAVCLPLCRSAELLLGSIRRLGTRRAGARRSILARFEFREPFLRSAINPRRRIDFA